MIHSVVANGRTEEVYSLPDPVVIGLWCFLAYADFAGMSSHTSPSRFVSGARADESDEDLFICFLLQRAINCAQTPILVICSVAAVALIFSCLFAVDCFCACVLLYFVMVRLGDCGRQEKKHTFAIDVLASL